jgi:hypothetical protein
MDERSHLLDITDIPSLDVWGDTVQARVLVGEQASLALVELRRDARAGARWHVADPLGYAPPGGRRTGRRGRGRHLLPGPGRLGCAPPLRAPPGPLAGALKPAGSVPT